MITVLVGDNSFEIDLAVKSLKATFKGQAEMIDAADIDVAQLPNLLMGTTLFSDKRMVVLRDISSNKTVWEKLPDWLPRLSDDIDVVIVDSGLDKRTKTYKALQKVADIREFKNWTERDTAVAERWVSEEAKSRGVVLDRQDVVYLVRRVGLDQWLLAQALEKLSLVDIIDQQTIDTIIEPNPSENVFNLFEAALQGDSRVVIEMLRTLELTEDPYRLFGLMTGQAFQLAALAVGDEPTPDIAKDIGAHPYALSKLNTYARKLGTSGARNVIEAFDEADEAMKTSAAEPWLLIERALIKVAAL